MSDHSSRSPGRRHGNLHATLLSAGVALAREGGPEAVVLREVTRRAGVVPNAAYRHFQNHQALFEAVRSVALSQLARAIEAEIECARRVGDQRQQARAAFRGVGVGYLRFARQEPGLFRTAFAARPFDVDEPGDDQALAQGASGMGPFQLLGNTLDGMVEAGLLQPQYRPGAEWLAWSAVHGMAFLVLNGPLRGQSEADHQALAERLVIMIEQGLLPTSMAKNGHKPAVGAQ